MLPNDHFNSQVILKGFVIPETKKSTYVHVEGQTPKQRNIRNIAKIFGNDSLTGEDIEILYSYGAIPIGTFRRYPTIDGDPTRLLDGICQKIENEAGPWLKDKRQKDVDEITIREVKPEEDRPLLQLWGLQRCHTDSGRREITGGYKTGHAVLDCLSIRAQIFLTIDRALADDNFIYKSVGKQKINLPKGFTPLEPHILQIPKDYDLEFVTTDLGCAHAPWAKVFPFDKKIGLLCCQAITKELEDVVKTMNLMMKCHGRSREVYSSIKNISPLFGKDCRF